MPISGMVATIEEGRWDNLGDLLGQEPRLQCGELQGNRLPLVVETADPHQSAEVHAWIQGLPGVLHVDVVFVGFEDDSATGSERIPLA